MKPFVSEQETKSVSAEKVMNLVHEMLGGKGENPPPDDNTPSGPWDPYIRRAIRRLSWVSGPWPLPWMAISMMDIFAPQPQPWREIFNPFSQVGNAVALNPQSLPPRIAFMVSLSQDVVERAALIHEVAEGIGQQGQKQGIIVVGGIISRFADDFCGTDWRLRWPFPIPHPRWWKTELSGLDLIAIGTQLTYSATETVDKSLQEHLQKAGKQFTERGMARM